MAEAKGIFVCYRRDESAGYAALIADSFVTRFGEDSVFRDIDTMEPGIEFAEAIDRAVSASAVLIAVIGKNWSTASDETSQKRLENPDDWVRREIAMALERELRVIPVLLPGASMPSEEELPDELAPLARRNAMELHDAIWREEVERLMNTIAKHLGRELVNREEALEAEVARLQEQVAHLQTASEEAHSQLDYELSRGRLSRPRTGGMKPLVAAAIPLITAVGSWITTGTLTALELSLVITGLVTALVVVIVPSQVGAFASSKAVAAAMTPVVSTLIQGFVIREPELTTAVVGLLTAVLMYFVQPPADT